MISVHDILYAAPVHCASKVETEGPESKISSRDHLGSWASDNLVYPPIIGKRTCIWQFRIPIRPLEYGLCAPTAFVHLHPRHCE